MHWWKRSLAEGYIGATRPYRQWVALQRKRQGTVPVMMLYYHRVDDDFPNPWSMTRQQFSKQLTWLQKNFDLISLSEAQTRLNSGWNDRPSVCITFDDGYSDNGLFAIPELVRRQIPATYFVTTHNVLSGAPFPHDVARGEPLPPNTIWSLKSMATRGTQQRSCNAPPGNHRVDEHAPVREG